jgi:NADH-quinone oxidoreductase subunit J
LANRLDTPNEQGIFALLSPTDFLFYLFAGFALAAAVGVVLAKNPVYGVLFLILAFLNASGLFLLAGAEFLAFILVIVYLGAVAVLFLFVVMMLDVNLTTLRAGFVRYVPVAVAVGGIFAAQLVVALLVWGQQQVPVKLAEAGGDLGNALAQPTNTHSMGRVLYTDYFVAFQTAGLVLLVAMIGAIVLTLRPPRAGLKTQKIADQVARSPRQSVRLVKGRVPAKSLPESAP